MHSFKPLFSSLASIVGMVRCASTRWYTGVFLAMLLVCCNGGTELAASNWIPDRALLGVGQSIPGFGETTERVSTADLVLRWERILERYDPEQAWAGARTHQFWTELGSFFLISDSDANDASDYAILSLSFLSAWTFATGSGLEPYLFVGGGPVYVAANIRGVGSDLCGNYQAGIGLRGFRLLGRPSEVQLKYHHISNLGLASPNIALNSIRLLIALPF